MQSEAQLEIQAGSHIIAMDEDVKSRSVNPKVALVNEISSPRELHEHVSAPKVNLLSEGNAH